MDLPRQNLCQTRERRLRRVHVKFSTRNLVGSRHGPGHTGTRSMDWNDTEFEEETLYPHFVIDGMFH